MTTEEADTLTNKYAYLREGGARENMDSVDRKTAGMRWLSKYKK